MRVGRVTSCPAATASCRSLPVATQSDGRPIVGKIRVEFADLDGFTRALEGNSPHVPRVPYEPVDTNPANSTLTVRNSVSGAKTPVPSDRWAFGRCQTGQASLVPTLTDICVFDGFKLDRIYELTYSAKNPIVLGLGYAVTRDLASFLRYQTRDDAGNPNPLAENATSVGIRKAYGNGISSTGMYMRDWLYLGFNEDESHRKVFDAVQITIPGTHRLFANVEFGDPNNYSREDIWHDSVSYSYPPLTYAVTTDPISGIRDGILKRPATDPLVFQVDSANEFWQMNASLNVHDGQGPAGADSHQRAALFRLELPARRRRRPAEPSGAGRDVSIPDARQQLVADAARAARRARRLGRSRHRAAEEQLPDARGQDARVVTGGARGVSRDSGREVPDGDQRAVAAELRSAVQIDRRTGQRAAADARREVSAVRAETRQRRPGHRGHQADGGRRADRHVDRAGRFARRASGKPISVDSVDPISRSRRPGRRGRRPEILGPRSRSATATRRDSKRPLPKPAASW